MPEVHNQNHTKLFQTVCEAPVNAPKEAFNLHDWVFTLSDKDYQAKQEDISVHLESPVQWNSWGAWQRWYPDHG